MNLWNIHLIYVKDLDGIVKNYEKEILTSWVRAAQVTGMLWGQIPEETGKPVRKPGVKTFIFPALF